MNDMNYNQADQIGSGMSSAAESVDIGDANAMLSAVRGKVATRRRRRTALMGVAAAGVLVASGAVVANVVNDNSTDDVFQTSDDSVPESTEAPDDVEVVPPSTALAVPGSTGAAGDPIPVRVVPATATVTSDTGLVSEAEYLNFAQLYAWQDGFLAMRLDAAPQPLPAELPQELVDLFPQEVIDLFPDGLPATIEEATDILAGAGLLDVVADIVASNPDVSDAIYSVPTESNVSFRFSTDGAEWSDIDVTLPDGFGQSFSVYSTGDRFVVVNDRREIGPLGSPTAEGDGEITVLSSTDLVNWSSQSIPVPAQPTDGPAFVRVNTYPEQLVANADRWVLQISTYSEVDYVSLLDEELQDRLQSENGGYGTSTDDDGITIEIYDDFPMSDFPPTTELVQVGSSEETATEVVVPADAAETGQFDEPEPFERIRFTWAELGLDGPPHDLDDGSSVTWTSNWTDVPVVASVINPDQFGWYRTVAIDSGFVSVGDQAITYSADGVNWSSIDMPVDGNAESLMPLDNTVVVFVSGPSGEQSQFQLDVATMVWTPIAIDGLPDGFSIDRSVDGAATLYEFAQGDMPMGMPISSVGTVEVDGFRIELSTEFDQNSATASYTVTDIATGEVVLSESSSDIATNESPFEYAQETYGRDGEDGIVFVDPATGEQLVAMSFALMTFVDFDADGEVIENARDTEVAVENGAEPFMPARWLVATNGTSWIVEQLSDGNSAETEEEAMAAEIGDIAVNNGIVLISKFDGTFLRYDLS